MTTPRKIFVNLPVRISIPRSGSPRSWDSRSILSFTDEQATRMILSDEAFVMLLVESRFKDFTKKELCDATTQTEAILALDASSRDEVDEFAEAALAAGAAPANDPMDYGFKRMAQLPDPDGHLWEVFLMNPDAVPHEASAAGASNVS